jgi:UDP-glucose 4-epimerase
MPNAVVTGGAGFIGSNLVTLLLDSGWEVTIVDNFATSERTNVAKNATLQEVDLTDREALAPVMKDAEYVFHLAALPRIQPSFDDPVTHEKVNVIGSINCLEALKGNSRLKKFVYASSSACYGNPSTFPTSEEAPISCLSPYALQKYAAEQYALMLGERFEIPAAVLRFFNVYGPGSFKPKSPSNAYSSVAGVFHNQRKAGQPLTITGDGTQSRDFVHVSDVARALMAAALSERLGEVYNVGSGLSITVNALAELFGGPVTHIPERKGEAMTTWADISKIQRELGWNPLIDMQSGIASLNE